MNMLKADKTEEDLSVIIVNYNTKKLLCECIRSVIKRTKNICYELIIVDNASKDGSLRAIEKLMREREEIQLIINRKNEGFAKANNQGIEKSAGRYILLLNSDTLVKDNVLGEMSHWMDKNLDVGIASCALKSSDGSLQGTGGYFPTLIRVFSWMIIQDFPFIDKLIKPFHPAQQKSFYQRSGFYRKKRELDWITGAFLLMRQEVKKQVGLLDTDYFMYTEDVDYCYRAKKHGWKVMYIPKWSIVHYQGASGASWSYVVPEYQGIKIFYKKHCPKWQYPILRLLLKAGAFGRFFLFGMLEGRQAAKVYAKAFKEA